MSGCTIQRGKICNWCPSAKSPSAAPCALQRALALQTKRMDRKTSFGPFSLSPLQLYHIAEHRQTLSARSTLGLTFGTKKSRKAILSLTENAISPSKALLKSSSQNSISKLDPLASAVVDSMAATTADMPTREEMQAEINASKPIPAPNPSAQSAAEVWTVETLVGLATLRGVQVKEWIDTVHAGDEIVCRSRFVAHRIEKLVAANDVKRLRGLRYLLLLIEWFHALTKGAKGVLRVPRREDLLPGWPSELVAGVGRRFAQRGELNSWGRQNLLTHILALALVLDGCVSDTRDVKEDLRLENKEFVPQVREVRRRRSNKTKTGLQPSMPNSPRRSPHRRNPSSSA